MCDNAAYEDCRSLQYVFSCFVTQRCVKIWQIVMIITTIINFFERENGNKQGIGKTVQIKKTSAHCLASHENARLVHDRGSEERD